MICQVKCLLNSVLSEKYFFFRICPHPLQQFSADNLSHLIPVYVIRTYHFPFCHIKAVVFLPISPQRQFHQRSLSSLQNLANIVRLRSCLSNKIEAVYQNHPYRKMGDDPQEQSCLCIVLAFTQVPHDPI